MANKRTAKEYVIDRIIREVLTDAQNNENSYWYNNHWELDLDYIRKTVTDNGFVTTGANTFDRNIILTREDWQEINESFGAFVDNVVSCYKEYDNRDGYTIPTDASVLDGDFSWDINYDNWPGVDSNGEPNNLNGAFGIFYETEFVNIEHYVADCASTSSPETFTFPINNHVLNYLSQLVPLTTTTTLIDSSQGEEILDTTIYELLPGVQSRQERIDKFFAEWEALKGEIPPFEDDVDDDQIPDTWIDDLEGNQDAYSVANDISDPSNEADGNITRLVRHEDEEANTNQSLEWLRNQINIHLTDIDKTLQPEIEDDRPEYENKVPGYLQVRGMNQSIIVRRQEGDDIGLIGPDPTNPDYLTKGFTISMWVKFLDKTTGGTLINFGAPMKENNPFGFMLETFVINKDDEYRSPDNGVSGTWGQMLELPIGSGGIGWPGVFFQDQSYERFIRLVVRENPTTDVPRGPLRDSHTGASFNKEGFSTRRFCTTLETDMNGVSCENPTIPHAYNSMIGNPQFDGSALEDWFPKKVLSHTRVPYDRNEWYFIVANYNPDVKEFVREGTGDLCVTQGLECSPTGINDLSMDSDYWRWNVNYGTGEGCEGHQPTVEMTDVNTNLLYENGAGEGDGSDPCGNGAQEAINIGQYTDYSNEGAKCKVEIISRSDLLRARGYKTN